MPHRRTFFAAFSAVLILLAVLLTGASARAQEGGPLEKRTRNVPSAPTGDPTLTGQAGRISYIQDPGFEAGYPNPFWISYSSSFGTVICMDNGCGALSHNGNVMVIFGGFTGDEGYVSQTINIPQGTRVKLHFWVMPYNCGHAGASNYLRVLIDEKEIWRIDGTSPICGATTFREIVLEIPDFIDGANHVLKFYSVLVDRANIALDDVTTQADHYCFLPLVR